MKVCFNFYVLLYIVQNFFLIRWSITSVASSLCGLYISLCSHGKAWGLPRKDLGTIPELKVMKQNRVGRTALASANLSHSSNWRVCGRVLTCSCCTPHTGVTAVRVDRPGSRVWFSYAPELCIPECYKYVGEQQYWAPSLLDDPGFAMPSWTTQCKAFHS